MGTKNLLWDDERILISEASEALPPISSLGVYGLE